MARSTDLEAEISELGERTKELQETADLPRSRLPGLFRAVRAAATNGEQPEKVEQAARLLGERLPDRVLLEPTIELLREVENVRGPFFAALEARAHAKDAWTVEKQALVLGSLDVASL